MQYFFWLLSHFFSSVLVRNSAIWSLESWMTFSLVSPGINSCIVSCHVLKLCSAEVVIAWKWAATNIISNRWVITCMFFFWLWRISLILQPIRNRKIFWMNNNAKSFEANFFFLFIGREPTMWPANNCLQIMVCSCAMPSNCVWLQIIFCTCVKETVLFSFLRSLLRENGRSLRFPRIFFKKTNSVIEW